MDDIRYIIESSLTLLDKKRGMRHRQQGVGLNLNRKHQNLIAKSNKANPNRIPELEQLRNLPSGVRVVSDLVGNKLKDIYGITHDSGFLGTTGIKLLRTNSGYKLIKEAKVKIGNTDYIVNSPDDIHTKMPDTHAVFGIKGGVVYYIVGKSNTHKDLLSRITDDRYDRINTIPKITASKFKWVKAQAETLKQQLNTNTPNRETLSDPRLFFDISGRLNVRGDDSCVVAFWNTSNDVINHVDEIKSLLKHLKCNTDPIVTTLDNKDSKLNKLSIIDNVDCGVLGDYVRG